MNSATTGRNMRCKSSSYLGSETPEVVEIVCLAITLCTQVVEDVIWLCCMVESKVSWGICVEHSFVNHLYRVGERGAAWFLHEDPSIFVLYLVFESTSNRALLLRIIILPFDREAFGVDDLLLRGIAHLLDLDTKQVPLIHLSQVDISALLQVHLLSQLSVKTNSGVWQRGGILPVDRHCLSTKQ